MNLDFSNRRATATMIGTACLFAGAFWLLDAGSMLWRSNAGFLSAIAPEGSQFLLRLLYAAIFAIAGCIAGAAVQRSRDIEEFAIDKLTESERKYHALLTSSFDNVLTLGRDGRIVELSDAAAALFGSTVGQMTGAAIDQFVEITAEGRGAAAGAWLPAANNTHPQILTAIGKSQSGRPFPSEVRITAMPNGGASAYLLSIREMTTTVVAQKALLSSERRYQSLFDNIPGGVFRSLPNGRLLAANPALVRLLGYDSSDELLTTAHASDIYCEPQQRKSLQRSLEQSGEVRNAELLLRCRDGSRITVLANVRAIASESQHDIVYEGTLTDISDLLQAREALQDSEEHFRALCENTLDVINVINPRGEILYASPSSILQTQRSPEDQLGRKLFETVHPDDAALVRKAISDGFARPGSAQRLTCRLLNDAGETRYIDAVGTAFLTRRGELRGVINSRDVTEQVETEARLREMQKIQVVGCLTKGLTHEFNSVLNLMSGNLDQLAQRLDEPSLKNRVAAAIDACRRGTDITRRMMAFADRADAHPGQVHVNALLQDVEPVLRRSLSGAVSVRTHYSADLWQVRIDPVQLEGAILQLAVNAGEAMRNRGELTISTRNHVGAEPGSGVPPALAGNNCISITVTDNGKGMSNEALARATDPCFCACDIGGHAGLGLTAVEKFIKAAGGELTITNQQDSSQQNAGTTVTLFLPRSGASRAAAGTVPRGDERVLVVDSNPAVRQATARFLTSIGYAVMTAADGPAALQLLDAGNVDLLLADLDGTSPTGLELARALESVSPQTKILLMRGIGAAAEEADHGLDLPYEIIRKPFRERALAEQARLVLET